MELVTGGDLFDRIVSLGHFNEVDARALMRNLLEVLHYLHEKGIVHRDIKPENVLMVYKDENTTIKVTDFGLAKHTADGLHTVCGTPQYFAPEIKELQYNGNHGSYGSEVVGCWSFFVLIVGGGFLSLLDYFYNQPYPPLLPLPLICRICGQSVFSCTPCWRDSFRSSNQNSPSRSYRRRYHSITRSGRMCLRWRRI